MKIYAISDLHLSINNPKPMDIFGENWDNYVELIVKNWNRKVKEDDVVLISGDVSWAMNLNEALPDLEFISHLKGSKVIVKGNHDYWWHSLTALRQVLPSNFYAIQNDAIRFDGVVICGSRGWMPAEDGKFKTADDEKLYKRECLRMELSLKSAKEIMQEGDILIVMTHYPVFNSRFQSNEMSALFEEYGVNKVIYGHLHNSEKKQKLKFTKHKIQYYLTSCDHLRHNPVRVY